MFFFLFFNTLTRYGTHIWLYLFLLSISHVNSTTTASHPLQKPRFCLSFFSVNVHWAQREKGLSGELWEKVEEIDVGSSHTAFVNVVGRHPSGPRSSLILQLIPQRLSIALKDFYVSTRLTCSGNLCIKASKPTLSTKVLGKALFNTFFLLSTFSYKSDCSSSAWSWLRVEESWSEMVVRALVPLLRSHSLVMHVYSWAAFSQIFCWISLT